MILNGGTLIAIGTAKCVMNNGFERKSNDSASLQNLAEVSADTVPGAGMEARKTVLIAEDYEDIRQMTRIMIELIGFDVIEAANGYEAVEQAKRNKPDVVLMDYYMPRLNGATACRNILSRYPGANVILVSGVVEAEDISNSGASAVLAKPVNLEKLRAALSATSLPLNGAPAAHTP